jgi:hypothetical protein
MHVWVVTDERYSGCDVMDCSCSGLLGQVFSTEQTAKQYADKKGGQVSRREVLTALPSWARR